MMNSKNASKAMRLEMVEVDHNRFAAEILRGNARINMTQMAKPFEKTPKDWLRTSEANDYISVIAVRLKCLTAELVEVRQGGTPEMQGTWCNDRRIALRFAQWLSPEFSVAVDDALMRLMLGEAVYAEPVNGVEPIIHFRRQGVVQLRRCDGEFRQEAQEWSIKTQKSQAAVLPDHLRQAFHPERVFSCDAVILCLERHLHTTGTAF